MTVPAAHAHPHFWLNRYAVAAGAAILAVILTAVGTFRGTTFSEAWPEFLIVLAAIAVATALVFWLVVPRVLGGAAVDTIALTALILGVFGFLSLAVFYLGLPSVLAAGAAYLAGSVDRPATGAQRGMAIGAFALAAVTIVLAVILAIVG